MSIENISLIIVAGLNFGLALMVWLANYKNRINIFFALSALSFGLWSLFEGLSREAPTSNLAYLFARGDNSCGLLVVVFFFLFAFYFPYPEKRLGYLRIGLIIISTLFMEYVMWFTHWQLDEIILAPHNNDYTLGLFGRTLFALFMLYYTFAAFYLLIKKYVKKFGFAKNILSVLVATGIVGVFCTFFGVVLPLIFGRNNPWFAPLFSIPMIVILTWFLLMSGKKVYIK